MHTSAKRCAVMAMSVLPALMTSRRNLGSGACCSSSAVCLAVVDCPVVPLPRCSMLMGAWRLLLGGWTVPGTVACRLLLLLLLVAKDGCECRCDRDSAKRTMLGGICNWPLGATVQGKRWSIK